MSIRRCLALVAVSLGAVFTMALFFTPHAGAVEIAPCVPVCVTLPTCTSTTLAPTTTSTVATSSSTSTTVDNGRTINLNVITPTSIVTRDVPVPVEGPGVTVVERVETVREVPVAFRARAVRAAPTFTG